LPENRKHPRASIHLGTGWSLPGHARQDAHCRDISLGGCFLEVASPPPFGASVIVYLDLPGIVDDAGRPSQTAVPSTVRWTTSAGMGLQFGPMGAKETAALLALLGR
jgi:type IV pilus assembly protein PilZ